MPRRQRGLWFSERPAVGLAIIFALGMALAGAGLAGGWAYGTFLSGFFEGRPVEPEGFTNVYDDDIERGAIAASILWGLLILLFVRPAAMWRRFREHASGIPRRAWIRPLAGTVGAAGAVAALGVAFNTIWRRTFDDSEYAVIGLSLIAGGVAFLLWMPVVRRIGGGRWIDAAQQHVPVNCPRCRHSMVGLHTTTCPECGEAFTIDALILAQGYEALRRPPPPAGPAATRRRS